MAVFKEINFLRRPRVERIGRDPNLPRCQPNRAAFLWCEWLWLKRHEPRDRFIAAAEQHRLARSDAVKQRGEMRFCLVNVHYFHDFNPLFNQPIPN